MIIKDTLIFCADFRYPSTNGYNKDLLNTLLLVDKSSCHVVFVNLFLGSELNNFIISYNLHDLNYELVDNRVCKNIPRVFNYIIPFYRLSRIVSKRSFKNVYFFPFHFFYLFTFSCFFLSAKKFIYAADLLSYNNLNQFKAKISLLTLAKYLFFLGLENILSFLNYSFFVVHEEMSKCLIKKDSVIVLKPTLFIGDLNCLSKDLFIHEYILFLRPNGLGAGLFKSILAEFESRGIDIHIKVIGGDVSLAELNRFQLNLEFHQCVDCLSSYIVNSKAVIITDLDGVGFSNRSYLTLYLKKKLISTLNGVRGIDLHNSDFYEISVPEDVVEALLKLDTNSTKEGSSAGVRRYDIEYMRSIYKNHF